MKSSLLSSVVFPVEAGEAYSVLREKFYLILSELGLGEAPRCLATSDFSSLYRQAKKGSSVGIRIEKAGEKVELEVTFEFADKSIIELVTLLYFKGIEIDESRDNLARIRKEFMCPIGFEQDRLARVLKNKTSIEREHEANETRNSLEKTSETLRVVNREIDMAADIQGKMLLSRDALRQIHPELDCHAYVVPCKEIGGDFFDVQKIDEDHLLVSVGDVSGKGITAAMMMATCSMLVKVYSEAHKDISEIMMRVNNRLIEGNEEECMFATLFLVSIDLKSDSLQYCNAGHNPAMVVSNAGEINLLDDVHGPAVGIFPDHPYQVSHATYRNGDRILLYTDGVSESFNTSGDLYGIERIERYIKTRKTNLESRKFLNQLLLDINIFSGSELAHDDVTLVSIRRLETNLLSPGATPVYTGNVSSAKILQIKASFEEALTLKTTASGKISHKLLLVLDELLSNLTKHIDNSKEDVQLEIYLQEANGVITLDLHDTAHRFNPLALCDPNLDSPIEDREAGGLGIFLIKKMADSIEYSHQENKNCLRIKVRPKES